MYTPATSILTTGMHTRTTETKSNYQILIKVRNVPLYVFQKSVLVMWVNLRVIWDWNAGDLGRNRTHAVRMCNKAVEGFSVSSLLHWAESNLPFFEYLLWECCWFCWSPSIYMERWVHLWLVAARHQLLIFKTHPLTQVSWLPSGNWHFPLLIILVMWHMYSWRSVNLHCRHIPCSACQQGVLWKQASVSGD